MSMLEVSKPSIPKNPNAILNTYADIWQKFIGTGQLDDNRLRPVIANSWLRSRELGVNPHSQRAQSVISKEELEEKLHSENLGISGKSVLDRMANTVKDTEHVIVLADKFGRILYSVGHEEIQGHLEEINFRPGSEWDEKAVGPNGIGTPLALNRPELILGSEHFCEGWQPWVCYGAPIHNPSTRSVIGCIDITGPANKVCVEAMALAISITHSIESDLSVTQLQSRERLRLAYRDFQVTWPSTPSLAIDEFGFIIDTNSQVYNLIDKPERMLNHPIHSFFPKISKSVYECLQSGEEKQCEYEMPQVLSGQTRVHIEPVQKDKGIIGCFVMFIDKKHSGQPSSSLQSNEDELIRKALLQTGGNISKAAKMLNINRTTIYRRRKNWQ
ncbi:MAG: helix-turn-helix domain-containing protein [Gammaproteobacteria bacterium]|jgi:transcriptional regulator of acetoin/glycerol metabolism